MTGVAGSMWPRDSGRRRAIRAAVALACAILLFLAVYNDYSVYESPIGKVTAVSTQKIKGSTKRQQVLQFKIKNGHEKGQTVTIVQRYDPSQVYDTAYEKGDMLFLNADCTKVAGVKRDYVVAAAILLLLAMLVIAGRGKGLLSVLCLAGNVLLFYFLARLFLAGHDILWLTIGGSILFTLLTLVLISGFRRETLLAFAAAAVSAGAASLIAFVLIWLSKDIGYEYLDFLPEPYTRMQANHFFLSTIIISCLGAVIDVAVTITASASEVLRRDPSIQPGRLRRSMSKVADDVTGTMINVLFFTNMAAILPVCMVSLANDVRFLTIMKYNAYFDIARFLDGAAAILIAIPVSTFAAGLFAKGRRSK